MVGNGRRIHNVLCILISRLVFRSFASCFCARLALCSSEGNFTHIFQAYFDESPSQLTQFNNSKFPFEYRFGKSMGIDRVGRRV